MRFPASVDTQPYWDALDAGELRVQRCTACGTWRHYPRPMCTACHDFGHAWLPVSGAGTVHSWTVTHQSPLPGFTEAVPFVLVTVDMAEGIRMLGLLKDLDPDRLHIGLPVRASVETVPGGEPQPVFRPV
ncbi:Zn-ribbon domain-containing OB-fold protein [Variovorax boronicumulans]|uniref:Zn-ribbon domain-containing OB-fold protein n=1 Tax=Variovorax boronicumulans TaxID=436515 RepID=UPI001C58FEF2